MVKLTAKRIAELEKELGVIDKEIDAIVQKYYLTPGGQNVLGNIAELSRMHAKTVEMLAGAKRELKEKK